jgi:hypothetical protein
LPEASAQGRRQWGGDFSLDFLLFAQEKVTRREPVLNFVCEA